MTSEAQAKARVAAAEKASQAIFQGMESAIDVLNKDVGFNGHGVIRDPEAVRHQLERAAADIQAAKHLLLAVDWPTVADYDHF